MNLDTVPDHLWVALAVKAAALYLVATVAFARWIYRTTDAPDDGFACTVCLVAGLFWPVLVAFLVVGKVLQWTATRLVKN